MTSMALESFSTYNLMYERVAEATGRYCLVATIVALLIPTVLAVVNKHSKHLRAKTITLGFGLSSLLTGCYFLDPLGQGRTYSLAYAAVCLCAYGMIWGFRELHIGKPDRRWDILAFCVIAISSALKFAYLESWPAVLTDYAATTGTITIESFFYDGPTSRGMIPRTYVEGGGASFLHAPLLALLFTTFDFSIFAVRSAEVIASIGSLTFFWLWLRIAVPPGWALLGLSLFTFSAEHLSQSRMGTFYSISQCVALAALWLWTAARSPTGFRAYILIGLSLMNLAVVGCYRPATSVWALSSIFVVDYLTRATLRGRRLLYACCAIMCCGVLLYYVVYNPLMRDSFWLRKPLLGTDTPIWQKTLQGEIVSSLQSPFTSALNLGRNIVYVLTHSLDYSPTHDAIYDLLYAVTMVLGFTGLISRRWGFIALVVTIGMLPSLTTFPLDRRSLLMRPLIPLCLLLFCREWLCLTREIIGTSKLRTVTYLVCSLPLISLPLQGVYHFTRFNGTVGVGPSFGPEYVHEMISHLRSLPLDHSIVVMNPGYGVDKFRMAFARELYITPHPSRSIHMTTIQQADTFAALPQTSSPTVYAVLNEDYRAWVVPWLQTTIPNINITPYRQGNRIIYWLGVVPSSPPG